MTRYIYKNISAAIDYYARFMYNPIEVPWLVSTDAIFGTLPVGHLPMSVLGRKNFGNLVGSVEQGFMQMMLDKKLYRGRSLAVSPCFRDELVIDQDHQQYFMKVELIEYFGIHPNNDQPELGRPTAIVLDNMVSLACDFFEQEMKLPVTAVRTNALDAVWPDYDIVSTQTGVELGSYGYREWRGHRWIYGTGLAEPRCFNQQIIDMQEALRSVAQDPNTTIIT